MLLIKVNNLTDLYLSLSISIIGKLNVGKIETIFVFIVGRAKYWKKKRVILSEIPNILPTIVLLNIELKFNPINQVVG